MKTNNIYLYDGSFLNLLNLIKILITKQIIPHNIKDTTYQPNLFDEIISLSIPNADIFNEIIKSTSKEIFNTLYLIFCSTNENKEIIIYYFFAHSLKFHNKIYYQRNLKSVSSALAITKYVSNENHKMKGFLRFRELKNNLLYAEIAPENNLLFLLSKHFSIRLKNDYWLIKDVKRNIISIYDKHDFYLISGDNFTLETLEYSKEEKNMNALWQQFYKTIGIQERKNDRCRLNFMPKKYWPYIIEMSDEL